MGQVVAGFVAVGTLVVVASIVYQVVNGKHSVDLAKVTVGGVNSVTSTLFK
jgi:hypothetical protein